MLTGTTTLVNKFTRVWQKWRLLLTRIVDQLVLVGVLVHLRDVTVFSQPPQPPGNPLPGYLVVVTLLLVVLDLATEVRCRPLVRVKIREEPPIHVVQVVIVQSHRAAIDNRH